MNDDFHHEAKCSLVLSKRIVSSFAGISISAEPYTSIYHFTKLYIPAFNKRAVTVRISSIPNFFSTHCEDFSTPRFFSALIARISALRGFFQHSLRGFQHSGGFFSTHCEDFSIQGIFSALIARISAFRGFFQHSLLGFQHSGVFFSTHCPDFSIQ